MAPVGCSQEESQAPPALPTWAEAELVGRLLTDNRDNLELQRFREQARLLTPRQRRGWELRSDGLLTRYGRLMAPTGHRVELIRAAHSTRVTAHPGNRKTRRLLARSYYWPRMTEEIWQFVHACTDCQRFHRPRDKTPGLLKPLPIPTPLFCPAISQQWHAKQQSCTIPMSGACTALRRPSPQIEVRS